MCTVLTNGSAYQPGFASPNKKHAKATAATVVLQAMGLVPKDLMANATCFRSASQLVTRKCPTPKPPG
ncbi:hypothetical protein U0070_016604 [Myodes glareolus]|uniref:DRBM domain-containing protein n=1 Tax=Myodes glareolus TaxID=447135 RepID=A0AAW0HMF0_MYOGA